MSPDRRPGKPAPRQPQPDVRSNHTELLVPGGLMTIKERNTRFEDRLRLNDTLMRSGTLDPTTDAEVRAQTIFMKHLLGRDYRTDEELLTGLTALYDYLDKHNREGSNHLQNIVHKSESFDRGRRKVEYYRRIHEIRDDLVSARIFMTDTNTPAETAQ